MFRDGLELGLLDAPEPGDLRIGGGLAGNLFGAACFAAGTALSGYALVAVLGAALSVLGGLALLWADRGRLAPEASRWNDTKNDGETP